MMKHSKKTLFGLAFGTAMLLTCSPYAQTTDTAATIQSPTVDNALKTESTANNEAAMKSLLFSDVDIAAIRSARLFYEQHRNGVVNGGIAEDDFLKNLEKITATESGASSKFFTYPQFFLSSIAYYSPSDWVVWINDEKITQNSGISLAGLKVIQIDNEKVVIEWQPERMDKVFEEESSKDNPVEVDFMRNKVTFSLKANQTFTSYAMRVVEGKVPPVTISTEADMSANMLAK
jgi:hypothetical protein